MGRPRKHPLVVKCEGCGVMFENTTGHPRRYHNIDCSNSNRVYPEMVFEPPPLGTPERERYDAQEAEVKAIADALATSFPDFGRRTAERGAGK